MCSVLGNVKASAKGVKTVIQSSSKFHPQRRSDFLDWVLSCRAIVKTIGSFF